MSTVCPKVDYLRHVILASAGLVCAVAGCNDFVERKAWQKAYDANYAAGHQEGWAIGEARGSNEGAARGVAAARKDAEKGTAWQLYTGIAAFGMVLGVFTGLTIQYLTLLIFADAKRLTVTVMSVPGMKNSFSYAVFQRRRRALLDFEENLRRIEAEKELQISQIQAIYDAGAKKIQTASSLDELRYERIVEVVEKELSRIISKSDKKVVQLKGTRNVAHHRRCTCPHCRTVIRYQEKCADKIVKCPNKKCEHRIRLPRLS